MRGGIAQVRITARRAGYFPADQRSTNPQNFNSIGHLNGVFTVTEVEEARYRSANPFDSPSDSPLSSSPSLSDEELYTAALQDPLTPAQVAFPAIVRKPPPLPSRASKPS